MATFCGAMAIAEALPYVRYMDLQGIEAGDDVGTIFTVHAGAVGRLDTFLVSKCNLSRDESS